MCWGLLYNEYANAQEDINKLKDYSITKKTYFTTPLFEKVFPGTNFYIARLNLGYNIICFDVDGQEKNVVNNMNTLIKKCKSTKNATIEEIIEAMIRLKFYGKDSSNYDIIIKKEDNKNNYWKEDPLLYNYKIVIKNSVFPVPEYFLIKYDGVHFINNCGSDGGKLFDFSDFSNIDKKINDVCVHINNFSDHVIENDNYIHFYKIVNTGQLEFLITNLEETVSSGDKIDIKITLHDKPTVVIEHQENIALTEDFKAKFYWTPTNSALTGICDIWIIHKVGGVPTPSIAKWQQSPTNIIPMVFIPENMVMMNGGSGFPGTNGLYQCWVYYCNEFFDHPYTPPINTALDYANCVLNAMSEVWQKEIIDWELADGLWPLDADNKYIVSINHSTSIDLTISYHNTVTTASITDTKTAGTEQQRIGFSSFIKNFITGYSTENNLIRSALCHEFFHGVHNSLVARQGVREDLDQNNFIVEGVARFLQTVFLESEEIYNSGDYSITSKLYYKDSKNYLTNRTNYDLRAPTRYDYCMFWRFLYENYKTGSIKDKLMIFKEICKNSQSEKNLPVVVQMLDNKLATGGGAYSSFALAFKDFAKRTLFNNCVYNTWHPCPSDNFYDNVPALEQTFNGTLLETASRRLEPFGVKYYHYSFNSPSSVYLLFTVHPNKENIYADYYVNVMIDRASGLPENKEIYWNPAGGMLYIDINDPNDKISVMILRTDTKSNDPWGFYILKMGSGYNTYDIDADKTVVTGIGKGVVNFRTSGEITPSSYNWLFPGGSPSCNNCPTPSVTYTTPGTYDVTLNNFVSKSNYILVTTANPNPDLNISAGYTPQFNWKDYRFDCSILDGNYPINYHFDFGDGNIRTITNSYEDNVTVDHTYATAGLYHPVVTVYDNNFDSQTEQLNDLIVFNPYSQIQANFNITPEFGSIGTRSFESTTTGGAVPYKQYDWFFYADPETHITPVCPGGYNWTSYVNWNNDPNFNGNPTFDPNYTTYGNFPVTLKVTDFNGASSEMRKVISIVEPEHCMTSGLWHSIDRIKVGTSNLFRPLLPNPICGCGNGPDENCCRGGQFTYNGQLYYPTNRCRLNQAIWKLYKYPNLSIPIYNNTFFSANEYMDELDFSYSFTSTGRYRITALFSDANPICFNDKTCTYDYMHEFDVIDCDLITTICAEPELPENFDVGGDVFISLTESCNNYTLNYTKDYNYAASKRIYIGKGYFSPGTNKYFTAQIKPCEIIDAFSIDDINEKTIITSIVETNVNNETDKYDNNSLKMEVMPNPSEGEFAISLYGVNNMNFFNENKVDLKIFSMIGSLVYEKKTIRDTQTTVDLQKQQPGIYMVKLMVNDKVFIQKLVLQ